MSSILTYQKSLLTKKSKRKWKFFDSLDPFANSTGSTQRLCLEDDLLTEISLAVQTQYGAVHWHGALASYYTRMNSIRPRSFSH